MEPGLFELSPPTRWLGRRLDVYREVDSTNRIAESLALAGAPEGTVVVADGQTAGRGRLGRSFFSPPGRSLYLSALLRPEAPPEAVHAYVFAAAVAVAETALRCLPPEVLVEIKWPNDVLLGGRKTSGINLPVQLAGERVRSAVLGIGVNLNNRAREFPPELRAIATSLREAGGRPVDRVAFGEALLGRLEDEVETLRDGGFGKVLDRWRKFFRMQGVRVRIGGPGVAREVEGEVRGVDAEGALLLERPGAGGPERILAGDVTVVARED